MEERGIGMPGQRRSLRGERPFQPYLAGDRHGRKRKNLLQKWTDSGLLLRPGFGCQTAKQRFGRSGGNPFFVPRPRYKLACNVSGERRQQRRQHQENGGLAAG